MTFSLLMDFVVAGLLVAAITYSVMLNRRLGALRSDKTKLEEAIHGLHTVSVRAEQGVAALRQAAEDVGRQLQQKIDMGQALREDLAYMIDRSGGIADRLENAIRANRPPAPAPVEAAPARAERKRREPAAPATAALAEPEAAKPARVAGFPSRAERELRRMLDGRR
jgi:hypothetical protein